MLFDDLSPLMQWFLVPDSESDRQALILVLRLAQGGIE